MSEELKPERLQAQIRYLRCVNKSLELQRDCLVDELDKVKHAYWKLNGAHSKGKHKFEKRIEELEKALKDMLDLWETICKNFQPLSNEPAYIKAQRVYNLLKGAKNE